MDSADLKVFEAVARLGAMNRAATELNTVQSNVTGRIRSLENELGQPLFERHGRGVSLTAAGRRLLPYAATVGHLLADARRCVTDDGAPKGLLRVGSLETTAFSRLSPTLANYAAVHAGVDLVLKIGTTGELLDQVVARKLDGAFVCGAVTHPDITAELIFEEEAVVIAPPDIPGFDTRPLGNDVTVLVKREGCFYRNNLEELLARRGVAPTRLLEFGTLDAILTGVAAGLGITLMPRSVAELAARQHRFVATTLPAAEARVETNFIRRTDAYVSSALRAFLKLVRHPGTTAVAAE